MMKFSEKLDRLHETVEMNIHPDTSDLADSIDAGRGLISYAIGSGGSAIGAEYLAHCRRTVGAGETVVSTPMEFTQRCDQLENAQVWLISAGGDNPDILAAAEAMRHNSPKHVAVVTTKPDSKLLKLLTEFASPSVHCLQVADKDGFLATHSLLATITALLIATDRSLPDPVGGATGRLFLEVVKDKLSPEARTVVSQILPHVEKSDTVFLLADPRLNAAAVTIETSLWEAAICPVQRTDFRNFAHGRHAWLHTREKDSVVLALTGFGTKASWDHIKSVIPAEIRSAEFQYTNCGRFESAGAIVDALILIEAIGKMSDIDPGKPSIGSFAASIYESDTLLADVRRRTPSSHLKVRAQTTRDEPSYRFEDALVAEAAMRSRLSAAEFGALIMDFDGTIVPTKSRTDPPAPEIVNHLIRLLDFGIRVGIATGRGSSVGEVLRGVLPKEHHAGIHIGYYNGGLLRMLSDRISDNDKGVPEGVMSEVSAWLQSELGIPEENIRSSKYQLTVFKQNMPEPNFSKKFADRFGALSELKLMASDHSYDILPVSTCKTNVVKAVASGLPSDLHTLCVGDSGGRQGNDFTLLGGDHGISVDQVCDRSGACWPIFGKDVTGPLALARILEALQGTTRGRVKFILP